VLAVVEAKCADQGDRGRRLSRVGMVLVIRSPPYLAVFALPRRGCWFLGSAQAVVGWYFTLVLREVA